jgi:hypothetical protein
MLSPPKQAAIFFVIVVPLTVLLSGADMSSPDHCTHPPVRYELPELHGKYSDQRAQERFFNAGIIPGFLAKIPEGCDDCFPGISDPGMDSAAAVEQALQRAAILHALSKKTDIHFITDFYTKKIHRRRWEVFVHLFEMSIPVYPLQADSVFINQFGEAVVLASRVNTILSGTQDIVLSGFIQEKSYGKLSDYMYRFEIKDPLKTLFLARLVNDKYSISTIDTAGREQDYPLYNYHYQETTASDSSWHSRGFALVSGLWPAVFGSVMKSLFFYAKETADYEAGDMRDSYSKQLNARLKRQTGTNTFKISYAGCAVYRNRLIPFLEFDTKK